MSLGAGRRACQVDGGRDGQQTQDEGAGGQPALQADQHTGNHKLS